jgi:CheY-like chemotaxis protein
LSRPVVLVVDDDPLSFRTSCRILRDRFEVRGALGGEDALSLLDAGERFDAILLDVMMPIASGVEIYRRVANTTPERTRSIVFMTGDTHLADLVPMALGRRCLRKPFEPGDLHDAVAHACAM